MNKIKLFAGAVFAGIVLHPVFSQPAASVAATNPAVYGAMVSNVIRLSTGNNEISVTPSNGSPEAPSEISNQYSTPNISNPPPLSVASNGFSVMSNGNPPVVSVVSNGSAAGAVSNPPVNAATSSVPVAAVAVTNVTVTPVGSNAHSELIITTTVSNQPLQASSASNAVSAPADSNENALADNTNTSANTGADTNSQSAAAADTNAIPETTTIRFQDIPITSVIENLARQAGINYLLDPKIGYGQVDPATGQTKPEPSLSLRWENITPEQALMAVLDNYGLQLVVDPKTKIAKVTIKSPDALPPLITHVYQLAYASVSNVQSSVQTILTDKRSKVVTDGRTSQLIVLATDPEQTDVDSLIKKLDKPTRQVLIETRFIEISSNPTTTKGVDWTGTLANQNITFGNGTFSQVANNVVNTISQSSGTTTQVPLSGGRLQTIPAPTTLATSGNNTLTTIASSGPGVAYSTGGGFNPAGGFLTANGLNVALSFLNSSSDAQVVSTPRIVTLDNEQATIAVTRAFPIFQTTAGTQGSPGGASITYSNVGIVLQVTPHISANDYIWMKVTPSISSFYATVTKTISGEVSQADEFDSRNIDTQVLIPNANTLVMGGMVKDNPQAGYTKVPLLGDIPVLGWAFRSENKSIDKQNLLIFITPTILKDSDFQPTVTDFMNSRPIKEKESLDANSAWDSGKPHDWSNPKNTDPTQIIINQKTTE